MGFEARPQFKCWLYHLLASCSIITVTPLLLQTLSSLQVKVVFCSSLYFVATSTLSGSSIAVHKTTQQQSSFQLGLKISKALGVKDLGSPGCSQGRGRRRSPTPQCSRDLSGPCSYTLHNICCSGPHLSPVHPISQVPPETSPGRTKARFSLCCGGWGGVMLPSALGFLFWMKVALHSSWLACQ